MYTMDATEMTSDPHSTVSGQSNRHVFSVLQPYQQHHRKTPSTPNAFYTKQLLHETEVRAKTSNARLALHTNHPFHLTFETMDDDFAKALLFGIGYNNSG